MFEQAKWISNPAMERGTLSAELPAPLMRKGFSLPAPAQKATLAICGLGLAEYYVNGKKVTGNVLVPAYSRYDKTTYYDVYDVTDLLNQGENAVAAMLGNGMYNDIATTWDFEKADWRHFVKLICELTVECADGTTVVINSDPTWKVANGPILFNHARCGEVYDARLEICGWNDAGFDDSEWANTRICRSTGGEMMTTDVPPIRVHETLPGVVIKKTDVGDVYDIGRNVAGWARIKVQGEAGTEIILRYAEKLSGDGDIDQENINRFNFETEWQHVDKYVLKGDGEEVWEPRFVYHGFRYVRVEGAPAAFALEGRTVHTDVPVIGSFECSDDMLNQIHMAGRYCSLYNFHGIITDCPHREQNGWTGDAAISAEQFLMNFEMRKFFSKWFKDITDCQRGSGQLPGIAPTSGWGYNWGCGPAWDSALILIPGFVYDSTADDGLIRQCWPAMRKYMEFIATMADHHLVNFGLGDWIPPKDTKVICDVGLTDTAIYHSFALAMARYAQILGEDGSEYEALAKEIRAAWRAKYLAKGSIVTEGQTAWSTAVYHGLLDGDEVPVAVERIVELVKENGDRIDCGILGAKYIFKVLAEHGHQDVLYRMVTNPNPPSYAWWILQGQTCLCEDWELTYSRDHHMFSEVEHWLYKYLAGIRFGEPGYKKVHIEPLFVDEVQWVKASHGEIKVAWDKERVTVETPVEGVLVLNGKEIALSAGKSVHKR